jgi:hypothetical protein
MPASSQFVAHSFTARIALAQLIKVFIGTLFGSLRGQIDLAVSKFGAIFIGGFIRSNGVNNFFANARFTGSAALSAAQAAVSRNRNFFIAKHLILRRGETVFSNFRRAERFRRGNRQKA